MPTLELLQLVEQVLARLQFLLVVARHFGHARARRVLHLAHRGHDLRESRNTRTTQHGSRRHEVETDSPARALCTPKYAMRTRESETAGRETLHAGRDQRSKREMTAHAVHTVRCREVTRMIKQTDCTRQPHKDAPVSAPTARAPPCPPSTSAGPTSPSVCDAHARKTMRSSQEPTDRGASDSIKARWGKSRLCALRKQGCPVAGEGSTRLGPRVNNGSQQPQSGRVRRSVHSRNQYSSRSRTLKLCSAVRMRPRTATRSPTDRFTFCVRARTHNAVR